MRVTKIVNVYRPRYAKGHVAPGFGDYIRGCFCLFQIARSLGLEFDVHLAQHPVNVHLFKSDSTDLDNEEVPFYPNVNITVMSPLQRDPKFYAEFVKHLDQQPGPIYYLGCNSVPIWPVLLPARQAIKALLTPTAEMRALVDATLSDLNLGRPEEPFSVVHLRTGDKYLIDCERLSRALIAGVDRLLVQNTSPDTVYLVLSDCVPLKRYLCQRFPNFRACFLEIAHLGEDAPKTDAAVRNTVLDFFAMERADTIFSITTYDHGSGFSQWAATTFNVPYTRLHLQQT
jgi:hypothetical protein